MRSVRLALLPIALIAMACSMAGCAVPTDGSPSAACLDSLASADTASDDELDELLAYSGTACTTADEWLAALDEYPNALGYESADAIDEELALTSLCIFGGERTAVCEDAVATGRVDLSNR